MSDSVDRRTVLKGVAASAAAIRPVAEALAAEPDGLRSSRRFPSPTSSSRTRRASGRKPYEAPPRPVARRPAEDQLRGMGKDQVSRRLRVVRRRAGAVPDHLLPSRPLLPEGGRDARRRGRPVAQDHLRAGLFRHAGEFAARELPAGAGFAGPAHPGAARRAARLAPQRLGRLPRRGLLPLDRRIAPVRPLGARRGARHRCRRQARGIPGFHRVLYRLRRRPATR